MMVKVTGLKCERCNHRWVPRKIDVRICPICKSAYWDEKRSKDGKHKNRKKNPA